MVWRGLAVAHWSRST